MRQSAYLLLKKRYGNCGGSSFSHTASHVTLADSPLPHQHFPVVSSHPGPINLLIPAVQTPCAVYIWQIFQTLFFTLFQNNMVTNLATYSQKTVREKAKNIFR